MTLFFYLFSMVKDNKLFIQIMLKTDYDIVLVDFKYFSHKRFPIKFPPHEKTVKQNIIFIRVFSIIAIRPVCNIFVCSTLELK